MKLDIIIDVNKNTAEICAVDIAHTTQQTAHVDYWSVQYQPQQDFSCEHVAFIESKLSLPNIDWSKLNIPMPLVNPPKDSLQELARRVEKLEAEHDPSCQSCHFKPPEGMPLINIRVPGQPEAVIRVCPSCYNKLKDMGWR